MAETGRIAQKHADLTVFDPPRRSRILAANADRMDALLEKTGFIDYQDAIGITQRSNDVIPDKVRQPIRRPGTPP